MNPNVVSMNKNRKDLNITKSLEQLLFFYVKQKRCPVTPSVSEITTSLWNHCLFLCAFLRAELLVAVCISGTSAIDFLEHASANSPIELTGTKGAGEQKQTPFWLGLFMLHRGHGETLQTQRLKLHATKSEGVKVPWCALIVALKRKTISACYVCFSSPRKHLDVMNPCITQCSILCLQCRQRHIYFHILFFKEWTIMLLEEVHIAFAFILNLKQPWMNWRRLLLNVNLILMMGFLDILLD